MTDTSWYPGNYRPVPEYPPHYRTMPAFLRIVDSISDQLEGKRLRFWLRARDSGLAEWTVPIPQLDLRFPHADPYGPHRVTIDFMDGEKDYQTDRDALHCFEVCHPIVPGTPGADFIRIDRERFEEHYLSRVSQPVKYLVAHEFGHSLGFGHGGDGIMDQTPDHAVVNDEEIEAATAYWFPDTTRFMP